MKRAARYLPILILLPGLLVVALIGCPAPGEPDTPKAAFLATLSRVEARDFESEWRFMSSHLQQSWGQEINELKQHVQADPGNRPAFDSMLDRQYELSAEEFLKLDPRVLHARFLEVNRQEILRYEVLGDARIEGDTAELPVRMLKDEPSTNFRYVRVDGRWLLDEGKRTR